VTAHPVPAPGAATTLRDRAPAAIADAHLQRALTKVGDRHDGVRNAARLDPHHEEARVRAGAIRREVLADLATWIDRAEAALVGTGATVHRAATREDAAEHVVRIAREAGCHLAVKAKSMATEEIHLNDALEAAGVAVVEGDLGEYIVQLAGERPSHIITPAIHKTVQQVADLFAPLSSEPLTAEREALCAFAREHLRARFLEADLGITGANAVAVDTGTVVIVTNEGNGRMATTIPRVQVVVAGVDKIVPRLADVGAFVPLLTRSATGQRITTYLSMTTGPRRAGERDGPEELHVVLLDAGRTDLVGTPYEEMLACIRCGACLNACPVYRTVGGHAYDSTYPGPMGAILTPLLSGGSEGRDLPFASSLCGACTEACPVGIPLADLLVRLRADLRAPGSPLVGASPRWAPATGPDTPPLADAHHRHAVDGHPWSLAAAPLPGRAAPRRSVERVLWVIWARTWTSPRGYRATMGAARLAARVRRRRWLRHAPVARRWTANRDLPLPAPRSFHDLWAEHRSGTL
jgi:L-lactate dehydrogenase complex protein LldF